MTKEIRFQSMRQTAETRAETTIRIAREIAQTEAYTRNAKTQRLKAARLEMLAQEADTAAPASKAGKSKKPSKSEN